MTTAFLAHLLSLLVSRNNLLQRSKPDVIFLSYDQGLISGEEFLLLYDSYKPQNLDLPYDLTQY